MNVRWISLAVVVAAWLSPRSVAQEDALADFEQLHRDVCASPDEVWRTIPWKTDLLEAQRAAVAESKPIFIWAMDGHPLGCT